MGIKYAHDNPTTRQPTTRAATKRSRRSCASGGKKCFSDGGPSEVFRGLCRLFLKPVSPFFLGSKHSAWEVVTGLASWVQSWRQTQHYTQSLCNNHPFACFPIVCRVCFSGKQGGLFSGTSFMCQLSLTARAQN